MSTIKLHDGMELELPSNRKAAARYFADMIVNRGYLPDSEERVSWESFANTISPKISRCNLFFRDYSTSPGVYGDSHS